MRASATFAATLAGALLVAGAGTGVTLAAWHDKTAANLGTVSSGSMGLTVDDTTSADLGDVGDLGAVASTAVSATVKNTGPTGAKDLLMSVSVAGISVAPTGLAGAVNVDLSAVALGTSCPRPVGSGQPVASYTGAVLRDAAGQPLELGPEASAKLCLTLHGTGVGVPPAGQSLSLTVALRGQQVAP